jgi:hypothetical protein
MHVRDRNDFHGELCAIKADSSVTSEQLTPSELQTALDKYISDVDQMVTGWFQIKVGWRQNEVS